MFYEQQKKQAIEQNLSIHKQLLQRLYNDLSSFVNEENEQSPVIAISTNPITSCGGTGEININGLKSNTSYFIKYTNPSGTAIGPNSVTSDGTGSLSLSATAGNYTGITATLQNCESNPASASLINPVEIPLVSIAPIKTTICEGELLTFDAIPNNAGLNPRYQWTINGINQNTNGTNQSFSTDQLKNNDVVKVMLTSQSACAIPAIAKDSISVAVKDSVRANILVTGDTSICQGSNAKFQLLINPKLSAQTFKWMKNGILVGNDSILALNNLLNNDEINVEVSSTEKCSTPILISNSVTIELVSTIEPSVDVSSSKSAICEGEEITYSTIVTNGNSSDTYQWLLNNNKINGETNSSIRIKPNSSDKIEIEYATVLSCGLFSTKVNAPIVSFKQDCSKLFIPNAIVATDEQGNNIWQIKGMELHPNAKISVFNRWGTNVYQATGYAKPFDGTINGKPLPSGTYYYLIEGVNEKPIIGDLTIVH